jgi:RHS repeat-associated protein
MEASIGLYFFSARWYDAALGRWSQPDTIVSDPFNPLSYDRYSYVFNNSINHADPTGHCFWDACFTESAVAAALIVAAPYIIGGAFLIGGSYLLVWGPQAASNRAALANLFNTSSGSAASQSASGLTGKFGSFDPNDPRYKAMMNELLKEHNQGNSNLSNKTLSRMLNDLKSKAGTSDVNYAGQGGGGADFPGLNTDITTFQKSISTPDDLWYGLRDVLQGKAGQTGVQNVYIQINTGLEYDVQGILNSIVEDATNGISTTLDSINLYDADGNLIASWTAGAQ